MVRRAGGVLASSRGGNRTKRNGSDPESALGRFESAGSRPKSSRSPGSSLAFAVSMRSRRASNSACAAAVRASASAAARAPALVFVGPHAARNTSAHAKRLITALVLGSSFDRNGDQPGRFVGGAARSFELRPHRSITEELAREERGEVADRIAQHEGAGARARR